MEKGTWAIVELMGHVKVAGYVTEETRFGATLARIDIPTPERNKYVTQYFNGSSIYRLTPTVEDIARAFAEINQPRPVMKYELKMLEG